MKISPGVRITPDVMKEVFTRIGYKPHSQITWDIQKHQACIYGALYIDAYGTPLEDFNANVAKYVYEEFSTAMYRNGIMIGFAGHDLTTHPDLSKHQHKLVGLEFEQGYTDGLELRKQLTPVK